LKKKKKIRLEKASRQKDSLKPATANPQSLLMKKNQIPFPDAHSQ